MRKKKKKKSATPSSLFLFTGLTVPSLGSIERASSMAKSAVVALENHLKPEMDQLFPSIHSACVSVLPTSLPPGRSVIHCPLVQNLEGSRLYMG
jgi:hypothetical protein